MEQPLLTPADVAARLNIRRSTVYAAAAQGKIPCVRLWKGERRALIRFRREDVERLIQERTTSPSTPPGSSGR